MSTVTNTLLFFRAIETQEVRDHVFANTRKVLSRAEMKWIYNLAAGKPVGIYRFLIPCMLIRTQGWRPFSELLAQAGYTVCCLP